MTLTKIGASLSGGADVIHITHASHPFTVGQVLRSSGAAGVYTTAQADSAANAEVIGIVVQDIDTILMLWLFQDELQLMELFR